MLSIAAAVAASGLGAPALAADTLWLDSDHTAYGGDYGVGQSLVFSVNGVNVRASAWSISNGTLRQARLGVWDAGLGVTYGSNDNSHTVDNSGTKDFLLFQFDSTVELDLARFNTGWHNMNDTDATIGFDSNNLSWASAPAWHGQSQAQLSIFDQYSSNWGNGSNERPINPGNNTGNMWLIGASFNNPAEGRYSQKYTDGFKLDYLTFDQVRPPLPEPSTWAMMLIGFFGLGGAMRSSKRREDTSGNNALAGA